MSTWRLSTAEPSSLCNTSKSLRWITCTSRWLQKGLFTGGTGGTFCYRRIPHCAKPRNDTSGTLDEMTLATTIMATTSVLLPCSCERWEWPPSEQGFSERADSNLLTQGARRIVKRTCWIKYYSALLDFTRGATCSYWYAFKCRSEDRRALLLLPRRR